ncbi:MAG TPA: L-2-hydroxyglutarate oxidase, partial [Candidatus Eisenbacteria bacterium]
SNRGFSEARSRHLTAPVDSGGPNLLPCDPMAPENASSSPPRGTYDVAVIGGGILGLATAREILRRAPQSRVVLLEKEAAIARHQTGHNSGVILTGVYYRPGSLKARLCVEGRAEMLRFCEANSIPHAITGKLIVAVEDSELPRLEELHARGRANGVEGLELLPGAAVREREPHATGTAALWVPGAGIVDYVEVAAAIAREAAAMGAEILVSHEVRAIRRDGDGIRIDSTGGSMTARRLVACAGLQCDRVAAQSGPVDDLRIIPFRGDYYRLRPEARSLIRSMIYPVPDPRYPFLGVHFTPRVDGEVWAGPNAVLSLAREGYGRTSFSLRDVRDSLAWPGLWSILRQHWRAGVAELWRDWVKEVYARDLARYVPEIRSTDLMDGPSGIRAQAVGRDGAFIEDFAIKSEGAVFHVMNAPSPAATSSFAIAREIAERAGFTARPQ